MTLGGVPVGPRVWATTAAVLSVVVATASLAVMVVADLAVSRAGRTDLRVLAGGGPAFAVAVLSATAVGVVLLRTQPRHPVGWCFAALGTSIGVTGAAQAYGS